jgi:hypothetical protein
MGSCVRIQFNAYTSAFLLCLCCPLYVAALRLGWSPSKESCRLSVRFTAQINSDGKQDRGPNTNEEYLKHNRAVWHTVTLRSRIKDGISWNFGRNTSLLNCCSFPQTFQANSWIKPALHHDSFLLNLYQFVIYLFILLFNPGFSIYWQRRRISKRRGEYNLHWVRRFTVSLSPLRPQNTRILQVVPYTYFYSLFALKIFDVVSLMQLSEYD